jgi:hypothetical protein
MLAITSPGCLFEGKGGLASVLPSKAKDGARPINNDALEEYAQRGVGTRAVLVS